MNDKTESVTGTINIIILKNRFWSLSIGSNYAGYVNTHKIMHITIRGELHHTDQRLEC